MEFVYPSFLYALFALAIPIIIHLFNFRRYKTLKFTNVRFLKNVKQQTKSRSTLKHLLVLLCRLLALAALVLAFAQPYIPVDEKSRVKGQQAVSVYLDNSFSMEAQATEGNLLNIAKNKAIRILDAYGEGDKFQLLTNDFEGKHQRLINKDAFISYLQNVELSPKSKEIDQVFSRQKDLLKNTGHESQQYFHITDLQKTTYNIEELSADSSHINLLPVQTSTQTNLYIDSIWFESPIKKAGSQVKLMVHVINNGQKEVSDVPLNLSINQQAKTPTTFTIAAGEDKTIEMNYTSNSVGMIEGKVSLKDYPVTFDDNFFFSYEQAETISVLHIFDEEPSWAVAALFKEDSFFDFSQSNYKQLSYSNLSKFEFLILDELREFPSGLMSEIKKFTENGGSVAIFPPMEMEEKTYRNALSGLGVETYGNLIEQETRVTSINLQNNLYHDVFDEIPQNVNLPVVNSYYRLSTYTAANKENILKLQNGDPFLNLYKKNDGKIYLFASSLNEEQSNLTSHAIFVPTLYNMALLSQPRQELFYFIDQNTISLPGVGVQESPMHLVGKNVDIIPEQRMLNGKLLLNLHNELTTAGFYTLVQGEEKIATIALNYNRKESELDFYSVEEVETMTEQFGFSNYNIISQTNESLSNTLKNLNQGISLWKYFIIAALLFLALEILFLRIFK